ncbi:hypothetical protein PC129_g12211 [Phytophthora cactorum]|uniref:Uncharacterized protein n=1 Tax=Phytophthora cactorum TaxID=29920 RepID=A0A329T0B0_9STRA|nr:hypothetical protein Pcac1_g6521 [Phytophthora cactorum]KAG2822668.1 hypothetical protein PC112_g10849 [Phytophthora cactorum]KAG2846635.1 hypothetical protein PC111_g1137 [Phytophthora cactorum]KAG2866214.1 hypothetical protein PC113_g3053 [Phytophthora cactorum]KAG2904507.1 hypothetical protein PC114_g11841 [Phytophthora cactorum]
MSAQDDDTSTYEETLETWALHDCSAIVDARSQDEMSSLFERFRATLGKTTTVTRTVTIRSLDKAWTAFVNRWNKEGGAAFERMLENREAAYDRLSVLALAAQVCRLSYDLDRQCCFAHFEDGCPRYRRHNLPRPDAAERQRIIEAIPWSVV